MAPVAQRKFRPRGRRPGRPEKKADLQRGGPSSRDLPKEAGRAMGQGSWARSAPAKRRRGRRRGRALVRAAADPSHPAADWSDASAGARELPLHHPLPSDSVSWNKQAFRLAGPFFETSNLHYHPHHSTTSTIHPHSHTDRSRPSHVLSDSRHVSSRWLPSNS